MAINPSDFEFAIIKETTKGVLPTTGSWLKLKHVPGTSPAYVSDALESAVKTAKRASAGTRKNNFRVEGGIATQLYDDAAIDLLLSSALSGTWVEAGAVGEAGDVLKAGDTDTYFSIEKKLSSAHYRRFRGNLVSKFGLSCEATGNAEVSFEVAGMAGVTATTAASGLTYTDADDGLMLTGMDVTNVTIAGLSGLQYSKLELNVETVREAHNVFGSTAAVDIGSGTRKVTLSLTFYRQDFTPETVLAGDEGVAVSFDIGGRTFTLPAAIANIPQDEEDGSKALVRVDFTAAYDNTEGTDLKITRN